MRYLIIFFCAVFCAFALCVTQAEVPKLINYQGKLTTSQGAPLDTVVSMQFSIYSDSTAGDLLWTETQSSVKIDKGILNVLLGSVNEIPESVFTGDIRYMGVKVGDDPEMTPRRAIVSVGYAYNSEKLDGRHAGNTNGDIPVNDGNLNVNLNADYLDGFHAQALVSPLMQVIRDTMWINTYQGNPRTKDLPALIDPNKSVVLLGQHDTNFRYRLFGLTSTSITIWVHGPDGTYVIDYQIIEYK